DFFNEHFYNAWTVAVALIAYGVVFIVLERRNRARVAAAREKALAGGAEVHGRHVRVEAADGAADFDEDALFRVRTVDDIDWKTALKIGCFQMLAIIPGTSRSGSTIIGGMLCGCSRTAAAEFTFFLAIPVMFGWGVLKTVKYVAELGLVMTATELAVLVVGIVVAFVVSVLSIKFLMGYIKKNDFTAFGWYRIAVGAVVLAYFGAKAAGLL
ncbi:MAG: undecaprenyl-diphosphate phosphatase, partial [Eggerthellaceae bacterium]|nr:undecaprenyl-diphosphate phosphatase [Eggerthellaceae bacterium]